MNDSERIDRILKLISTIWHKHPDLRLGQLLFIFADFIDDIFYYKDDKTEKLLEENLKEASKRKGYKNNGDL